MRLAVLALLLLCGCVHKRPVAPYRFLTEPEGVVHYTVPPNCVFAYTIDNPVMRESIGVMYCYGEKQ
jgi:hypothetical protein